MTSAACQYALDADQTRRLSDGLVAFRETNFLPEKLHGRLGPRARQAEHALAVQLIRPYSAKATLQVADTPAPVRIQK